jgi:glycosyltransferase involved in cell wall biosynthesis
MRILMLAQFYPPIIGGEERHVRNLSIALVARGHTVAVVTLRHEDTPELANDEGVRIYRLRASMQRAGVLFHEKGRPHAPPFPDPEVLLGLQRIIQRENPDIIHAHNWIVHSFLPLKACSHAPLVVTLHDYSLVCATKRLMNQQAVVCSGPTLKKCWHCASAQYGAVKGVPTMLANRVVQQAMYKAVDMFLPVSQAVAEGTRLASHEVASRVIPNFIPDDLALSCDPDHALLAQLPQEDFLLFVGDLSRDKGVEVLLHAYACMKRPIPLVLIGRLVHDIFSGIPSEIHVFQNWPHEAVLAAWQRCTIAIAPSIWPDPCPTVVMEAMCMGKPVIASRIGGLVDIVRDGESGLLVTPGDAAALQEAIVSLLDHNERREQMGVMAQRRIAEFQARAVVPRIEDIYHEVMARSDDDCRCNQGVYGVAVPTERESR